MGSKAALFAAAFLLLLALPARCADMSDAEALAGIIAANPVDTTVHGEHTVFTFREPSEPKLLMTGLIRGYQLGISAQDLPVCNFSPSCSRFSMAAIHQYGFFTGGLMTFDRLQRCNGFGQEYYPVDAETGKAHDSIFDYHLRLP